MGGTDTGGHVGGEDGQNKDGNCGGWDMLAGAGGRRTDGRTDERTDGRTDTGAVIWKASIAYDVKATTTTDDRTLTMRESLAGLVTPLLRRQQRRVHTSTRTHDARTHE